ncbi:hypothetical protein M3Y97_00629500 [Aphelenchoides bicaudatus]|nr:hypothetical protein M3Y97_00629500 [Aphelenchoides bicaudatus]
MGKLDNSVGQLDDLSKKFTHTARIGLGKLVDAAFKSKLKDSAEDYITFNHELSDELFQEYEAHDPFINAFIEKLDKLIGNFNHLLMPENYKEFLGVVAAEASKQLENVMFQCYFNRLGALQLDKEFRDFATYLTTIADWSIREKCARLGQLVTIMNVESVDEAVDYFAGLQNTTSSTLISISDLKKTLMLRVDLPSDRIKSIN